MAGGAVAGSFLGRLGQIVSEGPSAGTIKTVNLIATAFAGATLLGVLEYGINWLYQLVPITPIEDFGAIVGLLVSYWIPIVVGAVVGLIIALRADSKEALPIGFNIYVITCTILNAIRSVEPLIMAIVVVIWVGIGPFAGVLALALHTTAALAKLYSEQVESILLVQSSKVLFKQS